MKRRASAGYTLLDDRDELGKRTQRLPVLEALAPDQGVERDGADARLRTQLTQTNGAYWHAVDADVPLVRWNGEFREAAGLGRRNCLRERTRQRADRVGDACLLVLVQERLMLRYRLRRRRLRCRRRECRSSRCRGARTGATLRPRPNALDRARAGRRRPGGGRLWRERCSRCGSGSPTRRGGPRWRSGGPLRRAGSRASSRWTGSWLGRLRTACDCPRSRWRRLGCRTTQFSGRTGS